jgi:signal transduction histidine kinase
MLSPQLRLLKKLKNSLRGPRGGLLAMVLFYVAVAGGYGTYASWSDYNETLRASEEVTADYVRLLEEHTKRTLDASDLVVLRLMDRIAERGLSRVSGSESEWKAIRAIAGASPQTETLLLADAEGKVVLNTQHWPPQPSSVADRDFFTVLQKGEADQFIGKVVRDKDTGSFSFPVARRITDQQGTFLGVAAATIPNSYFKRFYRNLNLGPTPGLGVYKLDGAILVREPLLKEDDINRNMSGNPVYTTHLPKSPIGSYRGKSAYDGIVRVVSYRKVEEPPLLVWVSIAENDALQEWTWRMQRNVAISGASLIILLTLSWLVLRGIRRESKINKELVRVNEDLKRSNADLEQFAYIASHDLQEPLRMIASYAQLVERRYMGKLDSDADTFLGYIVEGAKRMQGLINELLTYSRVTMRGSPFAEADIGKLIEQAKENLAADIGRTKAEITVEGAMPKVKADAGQLISVFQNLISNAIKYQTPGNTPRIRISCAVDHDAWVFSIADNGIGIEEMYFDRIFLIFKRLHSRAIYPGDGIGLAHCKRVIERHGGKIWLESEPGQGSVFHFSLPRITHEGDGSRAPSRPADSPKAA